MKKHVVVSAAAERDIESAAAWYEARREGLGQEFYDKVLEAIGKIEANPEGFAKVFRDARKVYLRKFTAIALWYKIMPDESLVIACLSSKRDPKLALERASGIIPFPEP